MKNVKRVHIVEVCTVNPFRSTTLSNSAEHYGRNARHAREMCSYWLDQYHARALQFLQQYS